MSRPETPAQRLRALQDGLATMRLGAAPAMEELLAPLREFVGAERALSHGLEPFGEGLRTCLVTADGLPAKQVQRAFDEHIAGRVVGWTAYNPIRPEPAQRNVPLTLAGALRFTGGRMPSVGAQLYPRFGLQHHDVLRVVVCDGASMLAYLGFFRPEPFERVHVKRLAALTGALSRRLALEQKLAAYPRTLNVLASALDLLGAPAYVIRRHPRTILDANAAGREAYDRDPAGTLAALDESLETRHGSGPFDITPIRGTGEPDSFLAVRRRGAPTTAERVEAAARRWGLTKRQRDVLALVVEGHSNRSAAAELGISEKTLEIHLTALFEKAGEERRSALVARVLG